MGLPDRIFPVTVGGMHTRLATASDTPDETMPWLGADDPGSGRRCVVVEDAGVRVAAARRTQHPAHPRHDSIDLWCRDAACGTTALDLLATLGERPMLATSVPSSPRHRALLDAGASVWDEVPASLIDPRRDDVQQWIGAHARPVVRGTELDPDLLLEAWTTMYELTHAPIGTAPHGELRRQFSGMCAQDTFRGRVRAVLDADRIIALGTTFGVGDTQMGMSEAVDPTHADAAAAMDAVLASLLAESGVPMELDGHATFFHHADMLAGIPGVTAGPLTPLHLFTLPSR